MSDDKLQSITSSTKEFEEWDIAIDRTIEDLRGKRQETVKLSADAVHFLSYSQDDLETVQNQGFLKRIWGFITGKNEHIRVRSQQNLINCQKATLKLLNRLAERSALQMDAILTLANLVNYLHFKSDENKKILVELFKVQEEQIRRIEERMKVLEEINSWAHCVRIQEYTNISNPSVRLIAFVQDALSLDVREWHTKDLKMFRSSLLDAKFGEKEKITVDRFVKDLLAEEETDNWKKYVLPLADPSTSQSSNCSLPCHYALVESVSLQRSDEKFNIIKVASDIAASQGQILEPIKVKEEVLLRYLESNGVDVNAEIPVENLAIELFVGARSLNKKDVEIPERKEPQPKLPEPPEGLVKVIMSNGRIIYVEKTFSDKGEDFETAKRFLTKRGLRLPTVDEACWYLAASEEFDIDNPDQYEWCGSEGKSDSHKAWIVGGSENGFCEVNDRSKTHLARFRGVWDPSVKCQ
ncbi:MAG: hypothetical protein FJ088_00410 [Deltaproteobacteria bacterium]|nr:hypothetical protein [Deltaproteobacteria bacterium]